MQRVRSNLHIAISLSHAGNSFRQRCRMNPSLINCCTIDWFDEWNEEAMLAVAQAHLSISDFICPENEDVEVVNNSCDFNNCKTYDELIKFHRLDFRSFICNSALIIEIKANFMSQ